MIAFINFVIDYKHSGIATNLCVVRDDWARFFSLLLLHHSLSPAWYTFKLAKITNGVNNFKIKQ